MHHCLLSCRTHRVLRPLASLLLGALSLLAPWHPASAAAEDTLTLVVGYPAGGTTDQVARILAPHLSARLHMPVKVENRVGSGGHQAARDVAKADASHNVLLLSNPAVMVIAPVTQGNLGYNPDKDFTPVAHVVDYELALAINKDLPPNRMMFLVSWLWSHPEDSRFAVPALASLPHFFGLKLSVAARVKPTIVDGKGSAALVANLASGREKIAIDTLSALLPRHQKGDVIILATSGRQRAKQLPDVPTFHENGLKISALGWNAFYAPSSMPAAKVQMLGGHIRSVMSDPAVRKAILNTGMAPVAAGPDETAQMLRRFRSEWEPLVRHYRFAP